MEIADWERLKFWSRVKVLGESDCWEYEGKGRITGYGSYSFRGKLWLAHRLAWTLTNGQIPKGSGHHGTVVMHTCDNRLCVNPKHLMLGTQRDNVRDMDQKGRRVVRPLNGEKHGNAKLTDADVVAIRRSRESDPALAKKYGVTPEAINYARTRGWRHIKVKQVPWESGKSAATRGDRNANAKLTADTVRAIRASDEKPGVVARRYGIVPDYVTMIRKRLVWRHIE